jgi:DNA-binding MarR family transcriptional regulator
MVIKMAKTVEENAAIVLEALYKESPKTNDQFEIDGKRVQELSGLSPQEINDAVSILIDAGYIEWLQYLGTAPFDFGNVRITPRGKLEYEQAKEEYARGSNNMKTMIHEPMTPVGSPYGFTDEDWETVSEKKSRGSTLSVVFGYQFESKMYDVVRLRENVERNYQLAVDEYNSFRNAVPVVLDFRSLAAGYGEHLFNEICRDIISADIAVFDTSELNPNVMLEMGVALTWGIRVLPIKIKNCPKPPSDISGQTWADYEDSAQTFVDPDHFTKMVRMVERAARKKRRSRR